VSKEREVAITLTEAQVAQVTREALGDAGMNTLLAELGDPQSVQSLVLPIATDIRLSQALLRGVLVLATFPPDGTERELTDIARELGLSPSTTHRYTSTWMALGLLQQNASSRRYRRVPLNQYRGAHGSV
jgi:hypothetical protein